MINTPLAYLDPGTGSLFLQLLLGGIAGFIVVLKLFWHRILAIFGIHRKNDKAPPSNLEVADQEAAPAEVSDP